MSKQVHSQSKKNRILENRITTRKSPIKSEEQRRRLRPKRNKMTYISSIPMRLNPIFLSVNLGLLEDLNGLIQLQPSKPYRQLSA